MPHFFTDVRLVGPDGEPAEPGEPGEIEVAGPNVMRGYWGLPEESAAAFRDGGWLRSGDWAPWTTTATSPLVDRIKDMIISGGENIYPAEVENALLEPPRRRRLRGDRHTGRAVGRGRPRRRRARAPGTRPTAEELLVFLDGRLARYKIPKSVHLTDALPRSGAGKLLKGPLRAAFADRPDDTGA